MVLNPSKNFADLETENQYMPFENQTPDIRKWNSCDCRLIWTDPFICIFGRSFGEVSFFRTVFELFSWKSIGKNPSTTVQTLYAQTVVVGALIVANIFSFLVATRLPLGWNLVKTGGHFFPTRFPDLPKPSELSKTKLEPKRSGLNILNSGTKFSRL